MSTFLSKLGTYYLNPRGKKMKELEKILLDLNEKINEMNPTEILKAFESIPLMPLVKFRLILPVNIQIY